MTAYLVAARQRDYTAQEVSVLESDLQALRKNLIVVPVLRPEDVIVDSAGILPSGFKMTDQALRTLAAIASKGLLPLIDGLMSPNPLPWVSYRDLLQLVLEHRGSFVQRLVLYANRDTRQVESVGYRTRHIDLLDALSGMRRYGAVSEARLTGRQLQLWIRHSPVSAEFDAGYVLEANEGGRATWRVARAVITPYGGTLAGSRTRFGLTLPTNDPERRLQQIDRIGWSAEELRDVTRASHAFLNKQLSSLTRAQLATQFRIGRPLAKCVLRACAIRRLPLTGDRLLMHALQLGVKRSNPSVFDESVRRIAYYWLTRCVRST